MSQRTMMQRERERETALASVQEVLSSSGQPLDAETQNFMGARFGHDFSRVRVHTDERAGESAHAVNALAYTVGNDVVFDGGEYMPETETGRHLLAHELAHVVQQSRGGDHTPPPIPTHSLEQAAQQAASSIALGRNVYVEGASSPGIARQSGILNESLDLTSMSDIDLAREFALIQQWLSNSPVSNPENDQVMAILSTIEGEMTRRSGQQNQTSADHGQRQTNATMVTAPTAAATMLTPEGPPLTPTTPPSGPIPDEAFNNWPGIGETPFQPPFQVPGGPEAVESAGEGVAETIGSGLLEGLGATLAGIGAFFAVSFYSSPLNKGENELIKQDKTRAEATEQAQLPGLEGQKSAVDPTTVEPIQNPGGGNNTPTIDPVTGEPTQAPGSPNQSGESVKATSHILPPVTTPAGRKLTEHALESLPRHGQMTPEKVDYTIDNASRDVKQEYGAKVYIKKETGRGRRYSIVIVIDDTVVTGMQNLDRAELRQLGENYGFNPDP
jgi:Domain of unknown function (DUF4157)